MKPTLRTLLGLLVLILGGLASAEELPKGVTEVITVGGITEYRLENGMKVLLFPDASSAKTTVNITYLVGSRHEGYGETGMAHLLEHLLFKGSTNHKDITQELSEHGASANGTTWYDRTNYYETFPSSDENLKWALSLESDRMVNSFVAKKDLDSEMTVVRNEFERGENSPSGILNERIFSTAYLWHNYGQSTIGARSDIENVPIDRLQGFYRKYYQPDNAVLILAGRFEKSMALKEIAEKFAPIPRPERKLIGTYTAEPTQDGERVVELKRTGDSQVVAAAYHIPSGIDPDFAAVDVLGEVLSDTPSGRLYKKLVKTKLATGVSGGAYQLHDPSLMYLSASARKEADLKKVEEALLDTIHGFQAEPITEDEVKRAKAALLKSMETVQRDSRRLALQLSEWAAMGDWRLFFLYRERLKAVTAKEVQAVAEKHLKVSNRTIGRFLPVEEPSRTEITKVSQDDLQQALAKLDLKDDVSEGEVFDATPTNIKARTEYSKLSSGVKVALLSKKNRGEAVTVNISFRFGNLESVQGKSDIAGFVGAMMMRGTSEYTREQLKDKLTELKASGGVSGSYNGLTASYSTTRENLPEVLRLTAHIMKEPSFPKAELDTLRESYLASLEEAKSEPSTQAGLALGKEINPYPKGDPRAFTTLEEDAAAAKTVTLEQLREFHRTYYGADRGEISVVGDFDSKEMKALLEELFGSWSAKGEVPYKRLAGRLKPNVSGKDLSVHIPDKANAVYYAVRKFPITDTHPDWPAVRLANYIMGGGFLNSRLAKRVRQKEGLSYSIRSSTSAKALDPVASFTVYAISAPENMDKVKTAIKEELARAIKDGFSEEEVEAAKRGYLESLKVARSQDGSLAGLLTGYMHIERDVLYLNDWDKQIASLTPAQLQAAAAKYFQPEDLVVVTAGTLKK